MFSKEMKLINEMTAILMCRWHVYSTLLTLREDKNSRMNFTVGSFTEGKKSQFLFLLSGEVRTQR